MYDGLKHTCIEGDHIVNLFSFSKAYGMMGWRVGYVSRASKVDLQQNVFVFHINVMLHPFERDADE